MEQMQRHYLAPNSTRRHQNSSPIMDIPGKGVFLGLTLPLGSLSSYALIDGKVVVSTDVVCVSDSDSMVSPRPYGNVQDEIVDTELAVSPTASAPAPAQAPP